MELYEVGLNAPSGAGCFLTIFEDTAARVLDVVLMHLLVLGAFWHGAVFTDTGYCDVLMHLLVLGAF